MEKLLKPIMFIMGAIFVLSIITKVSVDKIEYFKNTKVNVSAVTVSERERQLECLSKNIYYEAGSEPFEGKVAVAQVNRLTITCHYLVVGELSSIASRSSSSVGIRSAAIRRGFPISKKM